MKTIIAVLSLVGFSLASPLFAAQADQNDLIAKCTQDAKAAGVQQPDMDAFISNCLDEKVGYEKEKPGSSD